MLAATMVKMSGSEKKLNRNTYDISPLKCVTREFLGVHVVVVELKQRQINILKSVLQV